MDDPLERWRLVRTDDELAETAFYCPECAEREFGSDSLAVHGERSAPTNPYEATGLLRALSKPYSRTHRTSVRARELRAYAIS